MKRIAVTGAAGNIAYSLIFRIASGELFGKSEPVALHLLEIPAALPSLKGVQMELEDCAFPLLKEVIVGDQPQHVFKDVTHAFLIGATPRGPGMERKDLLSANGKIFVEQGKALDAVAAKNVKVLVVGNPCNTNALIALHNAPHLNPAQFFSMTRLDQNRATSLLAQKAGVGVKNVSQVIVWGNHSSTQVPDFIHAKIDGAPVVEKIQDRQWLEGEFIPLVQKRGAKVIEARGKSSAASAANAALETMQDIITPTAEGQWYSCSVYSKGNPYGIEEDLIFSFPCRTHSSGRVEIVSGLSWDPFLREKILLSEKELIEEREAVNVGSPV